MTTDRMGRRRKPIGVLLYSHPFEVALGVAFLVNAARAILEGTSAPSVDALPPLPLFLYRLASGAAGLGILAGVWWGDRPLGSAIRRAALYVIAGVWSSYAVLLVTFNGIGPAFSTATTLAALAVACVIKGLAIRKADRVVLAALREANAQERAQ